MPGGLTTLTQDDFSGGMFQGPDVSRIPGNGAYDIVNGLVDSVAGLVYRRGGAVYKTPANVAITPQMIWDGNLAGGRRTLVSDAMTVYAMDVGDTTMTSVGLSGATVQASARPVVTGGMAFWPTSNYSGYIMYGGSRSATATDIATANPGSRVINGNYTATAVPGSLFAFTAGPATGYVVPVAAVDTTQITLAFPWPGPFALSQNVTFAKYFSVTNQYLIDTDTTYLATAANRLWRMNGSTIWFSEINHFGSSNALTDTNYHQLPSGEVIRGGMGTANGLLVFTNGGVWTVRNPSLNLTDAAGNVQQQLVLVYPELRLWHINGVVSWKGALIVPAADDVYLVDGMSSPVAIGTAISGLLQAYVTAGYTLGAASISNGVYVLPVLNGTTWVDTLCCRLNSRSWTRMSGYSGQSVGFAVRRPSTGAESLLSIRSQRVLDCTGWFAPSGGNKNEADGSTHTFSLTTRDFTLGPLRAMVKKIRLWVEGVDAGADSPTITAGYGEGAAGGSIVGLTGTAGASDGESPAGVWQVNHADKHMRFRFVSTAPWASLKIKALDVFVRPRGRA